jgi:hypothetical protein
MTVMLLDSLLIVLLLFGIKAVRDFYDKYKEFLALKNDLNCILRHVQLSMKSAQSTIDVLQTNIKFAAENVTPHLPDAKVIRDDLGFLIENGENVANRLEKLAQDMKKNYLTPQTVVFDPAEAEPTAPVLKANKGEEKTIQHRGFFSTISRVR